MAVKKTKKRATSVSPKAQFKITQLKRENDIMRRQVAGLQGTLLRSEQALADALDRLKDLERKVSRIAADPVVAVPHELKRRFEEHEAKVERNRESVAFELAGRAMRSDLQPMADRIKELEEWRAAAQDAQDSHEDRIDALEDAATSDKPKLTVVPNPAAN